MPPKPTPKPPWPSQIIQKISDLMLKKLSPGDLAQLRGMTGPVEPLVYWRLAQNCGFLNNPTKCWAPIVQIMALLTPKGDRLPEHRLHDPERPFGAVLVDGGDMAWQGGEDVKPFVSQARLARFLTAPADQRAENLIRIARMLAAKRQLNAGVDCAEIAGLLLQPDNVDRLQKIAQNYYARLDGARALESGDGES